LGSALNFKAISSIFFTFLLSCGVKKAPSPPVKNIIKEYQIEWIEKSPTATPTPTPITTTNPNAANSSNGK
jgi:hypothetical protein